MLTIKKPCPVCQGSGTIPTATGQGEDCTICNKTGYVEMGVIDVSDITNKLDTITAALTKIWNKVK